MLLAVVCLEASSTFSQALFPKQRISQEMQSFYQHPSRDLLDRLILSIDADSTFQGNENAHPPFIGFLATAFSSYQPSSLQDLVDGLGPTRWLAGLSLDLSLTKDTILNWQEHSPTTNDLLWGGFFASGDKRYIHRLVSEMRFCDNTDSLMLMLTGFAAKWSLSSNSRQYTAVKTILEHYADDAPDHLLPHIHDALDSSPSELKERTVKQVRAFKDKLQNRQIDSVRAMFNYYKDSLQLHCFLIADKNFFQKWQKPDTPKIEPVGNYKRGDDVLPIVIFATNGKDENGNADLSYDIVVTKPNGAVYAKFEQLTIWKDLPAPVMELLQQPILIHIEADDPIGIYGPYPNL